MTPLTVGALFSGIGGLELGLERAGMRVVWNSEIDPYCRRILAKHWPDVPNLGDVTTIDWAEVPRVDVICGGYPCQPFSVAGRQLGEADPRHLWPHMRDAIRVLRPRWALMENVAGHLALGFGRVLGDLAEIGYDCEWDCIPAATVGAPHRRDRVFVVAYPGSARRRQDPRSSLGDEGSDEGRTPPDHHVPGSNGESGRARHVADPDVERSQGRRLSNVERQTVLHACGGSPRIYRQSARPSGQWASEPDVGRVASRVPAGLDGGLNAHSGCIKEASSKGLASTVRLRALRDHLATPAASSEPARCHLCGHPLSVLPCRGACAPWRLGSGGEEAEDLRCLREGVLGLLACAGEDVQPYLSLGTGSAQCTQAVGSRIDRLRALGNAVVPQVAEHIGRLIVEAAA